MVSPADGKSDQEPILRFYDASKNDVLLSQALTMMCREQAENPMVRMAMSATGQEFSPADLGDNTSAVYVHVLVEELGATGEFLSVVAINFSSLDVFRQRGTVHVLVPSASRRMGYGRLMTALSTYWMFTVHGVQAVYGTSPVQNIPATKIGKSVLKEVGRLPKDWLWRGVWVESRIYALTMEDLMVDSYGPLEKIIKSRVIKGVDFISFDRFEKIHFMEKDRGRAEG